MKFIKFVLIFLILFQASVLEAKPKKRTSIAHDDPPASGEVQEPIKNVGPSEFRNHHNVRYLIPKNWKLLKTENEEDMWIDQSLIHKNIFVAHFPILVDSCQPNFAVTKILHPSERNHLKKLPISKFFKRFENDLSYSYGHEAEKVGGNWSYRISAFVKMDDKIHSVEGRVVLEGRNVFLVLAVRPIDKEFEYIDKVYKKMFGSMTLTRDYETPEFCWSLFLGTDKEKEKYTNIHLSVPKQDLEKHLKNPKNIFSIVPIDDPNFTHLITFRYYFDSFDYGKMLIQNLYTIKVKADANFSKNGSNLIIAYDNISEKGNVSCSYIIPEMSFDEVDEL